MRPVRCRRISKPLLGVFDSVVCLNVVEHVEDDLGALRNIFSALKPGGRAIILVPQDQKAYGTLDEVLGHYRRYSEAQLRARMEEAGFEVERMLHFNRVTRPGWRFNGQVLKRRSFSRFQLRVFDCAGAVVAANRPLLSLAGGIGDRGGASTRGGESTTKVLGRNGYKAGTSGPVQQRRFRAMMFLRS